MRQDFPDPTGNQFIDTGKKLTMTCVVKNLKISSFQYRIFIQIQFLSDECATNGKIQLSVHVESASIRLLSFRITLY